MRFITVAMRCEASPIIERFALKKEKNTGKFEVYSSDETTLVISGIGPVNAAIATSYLLSRHGYGNFDISANIGVCGSADKSIPIGTPVLCNRVIDHSTGREYFPDVVFKHRLIEASVETFNHPVTLAAGNTLAAGDIPNASNTLNAGKTLNAGNMRNRAWAFDPIPNTSNTLDAVITPDTDSTPNAGDTLNKGGSPDTGNMTGTLADMEASGFMAAVSRFLSRDNAICIKIVSDYLEPVKPNKTFISGIIKNSLDMVEEVLAAKDMINKEIFSANDGFTLQERELLGRVSSALMLSEAMRVKLEKLARYHLLRTGSLSLLEEYASMNIGSRKEGKEYFSEIESRIVQTALHPGVL
jgi:nucleoside phosphorylase